MQIADPRNADIEIWVGEGLVARDQAKISVFDSAVQGGDAVWEGLRVYDGRILFLEEHLDRLEASAHAMTYAHIPERGWIKNAIFQTLAANGMRDGAHIRLTLTRGSKTTSGMDPRLNVFGSCLIVLAEWKAPIYDAGGIRLVTSAIRRNSPQCIDSKIHHNNLVNNILAKIEANFAGVDDALMLDLDGFLSETNATNVFLWRGGELLTPFATSCLPGITRSAVLRLARENGIPAREKNLSLTEIYTAAEAFTTGTMGELAPVLEVDGRQIGNGEVGPETRKMQDLYRDLTATEGVPLP